MTSTRAAHAGDGMRAPWLSVLIPACNVAAHVEAMLHSVLAQADEGVEIVVIDDASNDATPAIVDRIAAAHPGLRLIRHPCNLGVAATRNHLLDAARGRYVWFVDADDLVLSGALAHARRLLETTPREPHQLDLLAFDFRTLAGPLGLPRRRCKLAASPDASSQALVPRVLEAGQMHVWSRIVRRELWAGLRFPERRRFEDMSVLAALLPRARHWRHVPEAWIGYRERPGSLSRSVPAVGLAEFSDGLRDVAAVIGPHATNPATKGALEYFLLRGHASIARRLARGGDGGDAGVAAHCHARFLADLPDRGHAALAACRRRGWWLRAFRAERAIRRAGWA